MMAQRCMCTQDALRLGLPKVPPGIIDPDGRAYLAWWYLTVAAAAWTGLLKPYNIAFGNYPGAQYALTCWRDVVP